MFCLLVFQEMLMSRRLPDSNPHRSSSIKRRLFQDGEEESEDLDDAERHRRLQMNRQSETENFLNRQAEQLDGITRQRWNFDFRTETPINNNRGQWEWDMQVVKLSETNVPKLYLNVLEQNDSDPPDESTSSNSAGNCPTCSQHSKLDKDNNSTPTKSTDVNEPQTPLKKMLVKPSLENFQCSSSKVPKSSSNDDSLSSLPCLESSILPQTENIEESTGDPCIDSLDDLVNSKMDSTNIEETSENKNTNEECRNNNSSKYD